jgi:hypothetical protein
MAYDLDHRTGFGQSQGSIGGAVVNKRWLRVGLLALGIFVINAIARLVTWKAKIVDEDKQLTVAFVAVAVVAIGLAVVGAWFAVRYPLTRIVGELGVAVGIGAVLSLLIAPFAGGTKPFAGGLGFFVGQLLMFLGVAGVGVGLGYLAMVAVGRDWKSRGLLRYELRVAARQRRVRG